MTILDLRIAVNPTMHLSHLLPVEGPGRRTGYSSARNGNVVPKSLELERSGTDPIYTIPTSETTHDNYQRIFWERLYLDLTIRKRTDIHYVINAMSDKFGYEELRGWIRVDHDIQQILKNIGQMEKVWALEAKQGIPMAIMSVAQREKNHGEVIDDGYHSDQDRKPCNDVAQTNEDPEMILENDVSNLIDCFGVAHRPMTEKDVEDITKALSKNNQQEELEFRHCGLNECLLEKLLDEVESLNKKIKIKKLSVTAHEDIDRLFPSICKLLVRCGTKELNIEECNGSQTSLHLLHDCIDKYQVELETLDLSYRENNDYKKLGDIIAKGISELSLVNCRLQLEDFKNMTGHDNKLKYLDISYNAVDKESVAMLSGLLYKDRDATLIMEGCDLSVHELSRFENADGIKIEKLDLSYNETLDSEGLKEAGRLVRRFGCMDVRLSSCDLTEESLRSFKNGIESHQFRSLDLSNNTGIASCHEEIAELTRMSGLVELDLSDCRMTSTQVQSLIESFRARHTKVRSINLSDSDRRRIDLKYVNALKAFKESDVCSQLKLFLPHLSEKDKALLECWNQKETRPA